MQTKIVFLIADGMGDYPLDELDGRTPLQAAETPNMDRLASQGIVGRCRTIPLGLPAGSDIANMALFGYDPRTYHTGRGPIEAAAQGLDLNPDDLVYRLNLCTVSEFTDQGRMLDYCAGHISTEQAAELIERLESRLATERFGFKTGVQYRHLLIHKHGRDSVEATLDINPPHDILGQELATDLATFKTSPALSQLVHGAADILRNHGKAGPANAVWPWGQGPALHLPSFFETFGCHGGVISAVDLVKGLGQAAGCEVLEVPGATGLLDTNYSGKMQAARDFLHHGDFVYLHLEGPDECGHAGSWSQKIEAIERFDANIVGPLLPTLRQQKAACMVACDHLTPVSVRTHTSEPVPFLVCFPEQLTAPATADRPFSEAAAQESELFLDNGFDLLPWILTKLRNGIS
jgi:2,3-bisphosphoglycerate-independent phosphoglycerate mutase